MQTKLFRVACCFALVVPAFAAADKLDDFEEAVRNQGYDSIPYSDPRSGCRSQQSEVHPWCDEERGPVSCVVDVTSKLRSQHAREYRELEELKNKRREAGDKRSRATDDAERNKYQSEVEALDRSIDGSKKGLEDTSREIERRKDVVEKTIYTINKCIDYRRAVMNTFSYAADKVRGESDPDLQPYVTTLRNRYPVHISGHEEQIKSRGNALETCKKELP